MPTLLERIDNSLDSLLAVLLPVGYAKNIDDPLALEKAADVLERLGRLEEAGKQYIAVAGGGVKEPSELIAFALPEN